jgi:hypothetical protein
MEKVVVVIYKKKGNIKVYGSLPAFFNEHESYKEKEDKINYRITRLKTTFEDDFVKISRKVVIKRNKSTRKRGS